MFRKNLPTFKLVKSLSLVLPLLFSSYAQAEDNQTYVVLYKQHSVPSNAANISAQNGGILVHSYKQIGVAIAQSNSNSFAASLLANKKIKGVSSTSSLTTSTQLGLDTNDTAIADFNNEPLADLQWEMGQIQVPEAHAYTTGENVTIGVIDGGIDTSHPDLASQIDYAKSASCIGGIPSQEPGAIEDEAGHGTLTAGLIAAASNGIGITGVAPNSKLAIIKAAGGDGTFTPEAVICSFVWAGDKQIDVTNNSYFVDPNEFNCHNDHEQHAVWGAVRRAIKYAQSQGVSIIVAAGNSNIDLAHPQRSEDELSNACNMIPQEMPGVITVSSNGNLEEKAYYSNYGVGVIDVIAPGGDTRHQRTDAAINGRVLSTFPEAVAKFFLENIPPLAARIVEDCSSDNCAYYFYNQGTSTAAPIVSGVAALAISQHGKMSPGALQALIRSSADPIACPENAPECQGGESHNSFNGHGQVNALEAVMAK